MACDSISKLGRITSGVKVINLKENETVVSIAKVRKTSEEMEVDEDSEESVE